MDPHPNLLYSSKIIGLARNERNRTIILDLLNRGSGPLHPSSETSDSSPSEFRDESHATTNPAEPWATTRPKRKESYPSSQSNGSDSHDCGHGGDHDATSVIRQRSDGSPCLASVF